MASILIKEGYGRANWRPILDHPLPLIADVSYDLWSFGCVLFRMATKYSLWSQSDDDEMPLEDLQVVADLTHDVQPLNQRLNLLSNRHIDEMLLRSLLEQLLDPNPESRQQHFPKGFAGVLEHAFFAVGNQSPEVLKTIHEQLEQQGRKLDMVSKKLEDSIRMHKASIEMLKEVSLPCLGWPLLTISANVCHGILKNGCLVLAAIPAACWQQKHPKPGYICSGGGRHQVDMEEAENPRADSQVTAVPRGRTAVCVCP